MFLYVLTDSNRKIGEVVFNNFLLSQYEGKCQVLGLINRWIAMTWINKVIDMRVESSRSKRNMRNYLRKNYLWQQGNSGPSWRSFGEKCRGQPATSNRSLPRGWDEGVEPMNCWRLLRRLSVDCRSCVSLEYEYYHVTVNTVFLSWHMYVRLPLSQISLPLIEKSINQSILCSSLGLKKHIRL